MIGDTIAAIATPPGPGGVSMIRISGPLALETASALFRPASPGLPDLLKAPDRMMVLGDIVDPGTGETVDEVLAVVMRAPRSFTGEEVVEIHAHGAPLVAKQIFRLICAKDVRTAEPGEFSLRAFRNGRMDLAQAEAVSEMILARSDSASRIAARHLRGELSAKIRRIAENLSQTLAGLEARLDFSDEVTEGPVPTLEPSLLEALESIESLVQASNRGEPYREGVRLALVGRPNVGKSSLLNAILGRDRALVTPISGTTRDVLEESALLGGLPVVLSDTAGLSPTKDPVEILGQERARNAAEHADIVLLVVDLAEGITEQDLALYESFNKRPLLVAANKLDLVPGQSPPPSPASIKKAAFIPVSALLGLGLSDLEQAILSLADVSESSPPDISPNLRQRKSLESARKALISGLSLIHGSDDLPELLAEELRAALSSLREITGETASLDLLDRIFSSFCIGK